MKYSEDDLASGAHDLLSAASNWTLVRHQWIMQKMRSILTGESPPSHNNLYQFDEDLFSRLNLPDKLVSNFCTLKASLELAWDETTNIYHPLSGLSVFDQLNIYQQKAYDFMLVAQEFNQQLWRDFTMRDPLTGTLTRLSLKTSLAQEQLRASRLNQVCSIALLDQDAFKKINDCHGHNIGDRVLLITAELIQHNLRPSDKLFRYGGDEWLILMPNTSAIIADTILKRIQKMVSKHMFSNDKGQNFYSAFSYGVAESAAFHDTEAWFNAADQELYFNKNQQPQTLSLAFDEAQNPLTASLN
jgi:diguanylate cyclase (GGDEF)-like protein